MPRYKWQVETLCKQVHRSKGGCGEEGSPHLVEFLVVHHGLPLKFPPLWMCRPYCSKLEWRNPSLPASRPAGDPPPENPTMLGLLSSEQEKLRDQHWAFVVQPRMPSEMTPLVFLLIFPCSEGKLDHPLFSTLGDGGGRGNEDQRAFLNMQLILDKRLGSPN